MSWRRDKNPTLLDSGLPLAETGPATKLKLESKQVIEAVGVGVVVISLLFVAYEIRQSNRIAIAAAEIEVNNIAANLNELRINNKELRDVISKIESGNGQYEPNADERDLYYSFVVRNFNLFFSREAAYRNGVLSEESLGRSFNDIERNLRIPGNRPYYQRFVETYPASENSLIVNYVNELLATYD